MHVEFKEFEETFTAISFSINLYYAFLMCGAVILELSILPIFIPNKARDVFFIPIKSTFRKQITRTITAFERVKDIAIHKYFHKPMFNTHFITSRV